MRDETRRRHGATRRCVDRAPRPESAAPCAVLVAALLLLLAAPSAAQEHPGKATYDRWCAECHGAEGRGDGPAAAYMLPRPRDFTQARYQIRTTASGALPTDADLLHIIENGMPGTAMPGWPKLSRAEKQNLIAYLKTFSRFFESEGVPEPLEVGRAPRGGADAIAEGGELYDRLECWKCHGQAGRGDGPSAPTQADDNDWPIRPADLTQNWRFNGGGSVEDIYMRLRTGLDGTPMPSSSDLIAANVITEDQLWNIAHYVRSLSPERAPEPQEVIRAVRRVGDLPSAPDDEVWMDVPAFYIPLVGQIIERPRWFAPTVTTVWVQAVHNGEDVVLRLAWNDPSRSPDATWEEWRARIVDVMEPKEDPPAPATAGDAFAVQLGTISSQGDMPYFLLGDARTPVHLWRWSSDGGIAEITARGFDRQEPLAGAVVTGTATHADGRWQLVLRRSLETTDEARPVLRAGAPIPIAFLAWDGSNGEAGRRAAVGSWYFLFLEEPATAGVWIVPLVAVLVTALLGVLIVRQAQHARARPERAPLGDALAEPSMQP